MPKGQRKDYSKEFKLSAVHLMKSKLFKPKEVFEMLGGIDRQTVYRWIKEYDEKGESAFDTKKAVFPYYKHYTHKREYRRLFYTGIIQADPNNGRCGCKEDAFSYTDLGEFVKSELKKEMEDNDAN